MTEILSLSASHAHHADMIANFGNLAGGHGTLTRSKEVLKRYQRVVLISKLRPERGSGRERKR